MLADTLAFWAAKAPVLLASFAAVLFMVGFAAVLGFRKQAVLDDAKLSSLAAAESASVEGAVVAPNKRTAFARLSGDKVMVARVMGEDVSARIAPARTVHVRLARGKLSARFADVGYPPLHMRVGEAPAWLTALAAGEAR